MNVVEYQNGKPPKIGAIGVEFTIDWGEDLNSATTLQLHFQKPDGSTFIVVPIIVYNNYMRWTTTLATQLDQAGSWRGTAYIVSPTYTGYGETFYFDVGGIF